MVTRALICLLLFSCSYANRTPCRAQDAETLGEIERFDPRFDALVPPEARIELLASGFQWSEGPVWVPRDGVPGDGGR